MIDYQHAQNELRRTEKKISDSFAELTALDYQRVEHFYDYMKKHRPEDAERFRKETIGSNVLLQNIMNDFHRILGYVLLIEKEGHRHPKFQILLKRARYMERVLHDISRQRKTQTKACRSILSTKSLLKKISFVSGAVSFLQEKRLILSFGKEKDLVVLFAGVFKHEKERIDALFQAYENEKKKDTAMVGVSLTIMIFVPAVGTALSLVVYAALQWANKSSLNYKKLMDLLHNEGRNGPTV
ncbi:MAG: hypothetical protein Q7S55_00880 [Nanoarchaeota archaeon]|nr:hypothetical protein [Nanoarchaeota archaeon]